MKLDINGTIYDVASLDEASRVWCEIRDSLGLGASDMYEGCGTVRDGACIVGRIAYNGKILRGKS